MPRRALLPLALCGPLIALSPACPPQDIARWQTWHAEDPAAAEAFAEQPAIQASLAAAAQRTTRSAPSGGSSVWDRLAQCESGGNWAINTGNGYYGGLQFLPSTWRANGGSGMPHQHSREEQIRVAENLRAKAGFAPWPACSRRLGLR